MARFGRPTQEQIDKAQALYARCPLSAGCEPDPRVETLVEDLIGRVADKWTMLVLQVLVKRGESRFTRLSELVSGISQKMLTQTLRQMERDGLLTRKVHPIVPPKVEYKVTDLGLTLSAAFIGVWVWAAENLQRVEAARSEFDEKAASLHGK